MSMAPVGLRARKLFRHWGAIPYKYMGRITERCRSLPGRCWEEGIRFYRTLRSGWEGSGPVDIVTVPEQIEHSVDGVPIVEGSSPVDIMIVPEPLEHSDVRGAAVPPSMVI